MFDGKDVLALLTYSMIKPSIAHRPYEMSVAIATGADIVVSEGLIPDRNAPRTIPSMAPASEELLGWMSSDTRYPNAEATHDTSTSTAKNNAALLVSLASVIKKYIAPNTNGLWWMGHKWRK
jgi:hypothetical protein